MTLRAHAKLNLLLRVLRRRPDGYHDLLSVMQTVSLHDRIALEPTDEEGIPTEVGYAPSMQIAANDAAVAISLGEGIDLSAFVGAPAAADGQLLHATYSGAFYELLGTMLTRFSAMVPDKQRADLEAQTALYHLYAQWIQSIDMRVKATPKGIEWTQDVTLSP